MNTEAPAGAASSLSRAIASRVSPSKCVCSRSSEVSATCLAAISRTGSNPPAYARFPHRMRARARGEPIRGDQEKKFESADLIRETQPIDCGQRPPPMLLQFVIRNVVAIDGETFV